MVCSILNLVIINIFVVVCIEFINWVIKDIIGWKNKWFLKVQKFGVIGRSIFSLILSSILCFSFDLLEISHDRIMNTVLIGLLFMAIFTNFNEPIIYTFKRIIKKFKNLRS